MSRVSRSLTRSLTRSLARSLAAFVAAGLSATVLTTVTAAAPAQAASSAGGTITRSEVLARAQSWVDEGVPYNQSGYKSDANGTYREDCSGYVSMAWHLTDSLVTQTLPNVSSRIGFSQLKAGDALDYTAEHTFLFAGWSNQSNGDFTYYAESNSHNPTHGPTKANINSSSLEGWPTNYYTGLRYNNIVDDAPAPPPAPRSLRPSVVADPATGHLISYVRDSANHLWSVDPKGPGWTDFGAMAAGDPVTVVDPATKHLITYVNGPDHRLWSVDPQGPGWTEFTPTNSGTVMMSDAVPSVVADPATGHLITYIRDTANHLWSVDPKGPGWTDFGAMAAGDPMTVVDPATNHLITYVNGPDHKLFSVDPQGPGWTEFTPTASGTVLGGNPFTIADPATGHLVTYAHDTNGTFWSVDPKGPGWTKFWGGPAAVVS
ncbi:hypothetical protein ACPC54_35815 [Kitasatospora sp. NPDC094028]